MCTHLEIFEITNRVHNRRRSEFKRKQKKKTQQNRLGNKFLCKYKVCKKNKIYDGTYTISFVSATIDDKRFENITIRSNATFHI